MVDIDKVIKGLRCIKGDYIPCASCEYANADGYGRGDRCKRQCASDAIELLKKQEAVTIKKIKDNAFGVYGGICPKCKNWIQSPHSYCGFCDQAVKWDD